MTTPFCYELSTFTLISAMLTTKGHCFINVILSQKKHRKVFALFVKKKKKRLDYDNRKLLYSSNFFFCLFNHSGSGYCEQKPCKFTVTEEWTKENQDMSLPLALNFFYQELLISASFLLLWMNQIPNMLMEISRQRYNLVEFYPIIHYTIVSENFNMYLLMDF